MDLGIVANICGQVGTTCVLAAFFGLIGGADPEVPTCTHAACTRVTVTVAPSAITLAPGASASFTANVENAANDGVSWTLEPAGCGTITDAGVYTAPAMPGECTVVARSQRVSSARDEARISVVAP